VADGPVLVAVSKEDIDKLTKLTDAVERLIDCATVSKKALTISDLPKTVTMADIKEHYGIGKDKWRTELSRVSFRNP
jgi:hypothetical protein